MKLSNLLKDGELVLLNGIDADDIEIRTGYVGDLLSDVLANAEPGALWFTVQRHKNILAVATAKDIPAIVLVNNIKADRELLETAGKMGIAILGTEKSGFDAGGIFYLMLKNDLHS